MDSDQKRAFLAVVLSGMILFGWQYFFAPKTPSKETNKELVAKQTQNQNQPTSNQNQVVGNEKTTPTISQNDDVEKNTQEIIIFNNNTRYVLDSFLNIIDANNKNAKFSYIETVGSKNTFNVEFNNGNGLKKLFFNFEKVSDAEYKVTSGDVNGTILLEENGKLNFNLYSTGFKSVKFNYATEKKELEGGKFREFVYLDDDLETSRVEDADKTDAAVKWMGINFNYHLFATIFPNKVDSRIVLTEEGEFNLRQNVKNDLSFKVIFTKKEYNDLKKLGDNLHLSVDFGVWTILAEPILWLLQKIHDSIPNYGIAIIFLTLIIRLVTFPLQWKSFQSMKKMQTIQPELTKLREKYKEDPQRMQRESMELFKRAGANPLGGCLPLMLQMPVFFALYKVLYSSVELVGAPFYFWITDLSNKDPYYVLPLLMAGAMFLQQKVTPTTVSDPTQKKVMMFMPLIFGLIMKDLPSGLCLYILVSTVFGMLQQLFVYKRTA